MSRSWPVFCAIALLFVLFLFPSAAHAANLLTINPGFDNGPPGGELPPGWVVFTGRMGENMWVEPAGTYGPSQVLVIDTKGQQNSGLRSEAIPAAAGERYEARARVYATPGNRTGLYIDFWNANRQRIAAKSVMSTTTNQWETLSVTMDAPEGTAYVSLILYSNATSGPGLVAWDDAMLIKDMSYIVYLTPDHEDYLYEVGETANIGVKIIQGGKPVEGRVALQYRISLENGTHHFAPLAGGVRWFFFEAASLEALT